jgi:hypothetical protein
MIKFGGAGLRLNGILGGMRRNRANSMRTFYAEIS